MKKRNWLMTIAFAVLSLTIVSTMVIGSTYAKFTSQVAGKGTAQAAGFLVAGTIADATATSLMAPGEAYEVTVPMTYFSQVLTKISTPGGTNATGTGVFDSTVWSNVVSFYNTNWKKIGAALGYGTYNSTGDEFAANGIGNYGPVAANLAVTDVIKTSGAGNASFVSTFISSIMTDGTNSTTDNTELFIKTAGTVAAKADQNGATEANVIPAMLADANRVISVNLKLSIAWVSPKPSAAVGANETANDTNAANDLFDTYLGNLIARFATNTDLVYSYVDLGAAGTELDPTVKTLDVAKTSATTIVRPNSATQSTVTINIGVKAEQLAANTALYDVAGAPSYTVS